MRTGEQRARPRQGLSRGRILAEAARFFNRLGYHGATLDDVARALGVTKAALYYHVANKEELLFQCCKVAIAIGLEGIRRAQAETAAPDEQLRRALAAALEAALARALPRGEGRARRVRAGAPGDHRARRRAGGVRALRLAPRRLRAARRHELDPEVVQPRRQPLRGRGRRGLRRVPRARAPGERPRAGADGGGAADIRPPPAPGPA